MRAALLRGLVPTLPAVAAAVACRRSAKPVALAGPIPESAGPTHHDFVIIGSGTAAHAALEGIASRAPDADILIVSDQPSLSRVDVQKQRSPLPPDLQTSFSEWKRHVTSALEVNNTQAKVVLGRKNIVIDGNCNTLRFEDGQEVHFGRCLIATAGKSRPFYCLSKDKMAYASLADRLNTLGSLKAFQQLAMLDHCYPPVKTVAVVGGGFLGTEIALALAGRGYMVWQVYAEQMPLHRELPPYLCEHLQQLLRTQGVQPLPERIVTEVEPLVFEETATAIQQQRLQGEGGEEEAQQQDDGSAAAMRIQLVGWQRESLSCDYAVLASTRVDPNLDPIDVRRSGLEVDREHGGVVVNCQLEAMANVYAAGSCASYYDVALGRRRVDSFDHSVNSGLHAGLNMTREHVGSSARMEQYTHQPMFRSQLHGVGVVCEGMGQVDSKLRTVGIWQTRGNGLAASSRAQHSVGSSGGSGSGSCGGAALHRGVVYYLDDNNRIAGVLLWNASDLLERARELLRSQPFAQLDTSAAGLKRQIALAPDDWLAVRETPPQQRSTA